MPLKKTTVSLLPLQLGYLGLLPLRLLTAWQEGKGLCFIGIGDPAAVETSLQNQYPHWDAVSLSAEALPEWLLPWVAALKDALKTGRLPANEALPLLLEGTAFQQSVWRALAALPLGDCFSYQTLATTLNNPKAVRAVGTALGKNPLALLLPCHRVQRSNAATAGYRWSLDTAALLLEAEGALQALQQCLPSTSPESAGTGLLKQGLLCYTQQGA